MKAKTALGAVGIGVASAVVLFATHRTLSTDGGSTEPAVATAPRSADSVIERDGASAPALGDGELLARAESADGLASPGAHGPDEDETASSAELRAEADAPAANPHIEALSHPSPGYRNVSLATVIREAGHVCTDVLSSSSTHENLGAWRVSCEGGRAYFVFEDAPGSLRVEPMMYFDSPAPFIQRDSENGPVLVPVPRPE